MTSVSGAATAFAIQRAKKYSTTKLRAVMLKAGEKRHIDPLHGHQYPYRIRSETRCPCNIPNFCGTQKHPRPKRGEMLSFNIATNCPV